MPSLVRVAIVTTAVKSGKDYLLLDQNERDHVCSNLNAVCESMKKCIAFASDGSPPIQTTSRRLWDDAKGRTGFLVCVFPSTFEEPTVEAPAAFPIGNDEYIDVLFQGRLSDHRAPP